ncbi:MAG: Zn-ribbon domain-containing OB-fold protein, partial [Chloroflexota bacterium]
MADYNKPLPLTDPDTQPYWEGAKAHELRAQKCSSCGKLRWPPQGFCPHCWSWESSSTRRSPCSARPPSRPRREWRRLLCRRRRRRLSDQELSLARVRAALRADAERSEAVRFAAADFACFDSAAGEAAEWPSFFSALLVALDRVRE